LSSLEITVELEEFPEFLKKWPNKIITRRLKLVDVFSNRCQCLDPFLFITVGESSANQCCFAAKDIHNWEPTLI
jgi:hypothetical protein